MQVQKRGDLDLYIYLEPSMGGAMATDGPRLMTFHRTYLCGFCRQAYLQTRDGVAPRPPMAVCAGTARAAGDRCSGTTNYTSTSADAVPSISSYRQIPRNDYLFWSSTRFVR